MAVPTDRNFLVVSDTHISVRSDPLHVQRFCDFLGRVAAEGTVECGTSVIAGDLFNLDVLDPAGGRAAESGAGGRLTGILERFPSIGKAISRLLAAGIDVIVMAGNHDVELLDPGVTATFRRAIQLQAENEAGPGGGRLELPSRTFLRVGGVHIEHGNGFDRDNCFDDASLDAVRSGMAPRFPLGSMLERRFASRVPQLDYHGFSSSTAWPLLKAVLRRHGLFGGLRIICRYYMAAVEMLAESCRRRRLACKPGESRTPTLCSPLRTFHRLYLDRSVACLAAFLWLLLTPLALDSWMALWLAGSGCLALALSASLAGGNRYGAMASAACKQGVRELMRDSSVTAVIMGHSHEAVESVIDGAGRQYLNSGAFLSPDPEACPYVRITPAGHGHLARLRFFSQANDGKPSHQSVCGPEGRR